MSLCVLGLMNPVTTGFSQAPGAAGEAPARYDLQCGPFLLRELGPLSPTMAHLREPVNMCLEP